MNSIYCRELIIDYKNHVSESKSRFYGQTRHIAFNNQAKILEFLFRFWAYTVPCNEIDCVLQEPLKYRGNSRHGAMETSRAETRRLNYTARIQ